MRTAGNGLHSCFAQCRKRCMRATESPPPETARAALEAETKASRARLSAKARCRSRNALLTFVGGALRAGAGCDSLGCVRIFRWERGKSGTTFLHLAQFEQSEPEFQHPFRRALGFGIFLQQLRKVARRFGVILLCRI